MTDYDKIWYILKNIIEYDGEIEEEKITLSASLREDLGLDSLEIYEIIYTIEEELKISIPDDKAAEFETINDIFKYLYVKITGKVIDFDKESIMICCGIIKNCLDENIINREIIKLQLKTIAILLNK